MKCPKCKDEYRDGFEICADCNIPLVADDWEEEPLQPEYETVKEEEVQFSDIIEDVINHLKFFGFSIEKDNGSYTAIHPKQDRPLYFIEYKNGVIFEIWFTLTDEAEKNYHEYLSFVNGINNDVPILRASHRENENAFVLDIWFSGNYNKITFENFISNWFEEMSIVLQNENLKKYLV